MRLELLFRTVIWKGSAETRTRIAGFQVQMVNNYTIERQGLQIYMLYHHSYMISYMIWKGSTEIQTRIAGFKAENANHYTIEPHAP